jgi:RNA polymerase primary sigma factor
VPLCETIADPNTPTPALSVIHQEVVFLLQMLLNLLTPKQREVIELRYGLLGDRQGLTLQEVAAVTGVTWGQVHRCEQRALQRIRRGHGLLVAREIAACVG